jgi:hypothetical protein
MIKAYWETLLKRFNIILDNQKGFIYLKPDGLMRESINENEVLKIRAFQIAVMAGVIIGGFLLYKMIRAKRFLTENYFLTLKTEVSPYQYKFSFICSAFLMFDNCEKRKASNTNFLPRTPIKFISVPSTGSTVLCLRFFIGLHNESGSAGAFGHTNFYLPCLRFFYNQHCHQYIHLAATFPTILCTYAEGPLECLADEKLFTEVKEAALYLDAEW